MDIIDRLAEQYINEALARGELTGLAGEGKPLPPDACANAPESVRMAYRVLHNAGYLPPEVMLLREIHDVETLLAQAEDDDMRKGYQRRLQLLDMRLEASRGYGLSLLTREKIVQQNLEKAGE